MRRKLVLLALAFCAALALAACGGGEKAPDPYQTSDAQKLADAGAFSETLEAVDADTAFLLYRLEDFGLTREEMTDCLALHSTGATCEEGVVLVLSGEEQAEKAAEALTAYVSDQIEANTDYRPPEIPKLESAVVDRRGATVLLIVANDLDAAKKAVGLE